MLGMKNYTQDYVDACRRRVDSQISAYRALVAAASGGAGADEAPIDAALAGFAPVFFNNMVLVLDTCFTHRLRTIEGKDGNPLNEVRVLCSSMMLNGSVVAADKSIKMKPETSVLGHRIGDEIALDETDFVKLSDAFFAEIERKYV